VKCGPLAAVAADSSENRGRMNASCLAWFKATAYTAG